MGSEGVVVLAIIDAVVVVMFFLFRVLPWSKPGPWRLIWTIASLGFMFFSLAEVAAIVEGGSALAIEVQGPLFGAILATTTCFIFMYLHSARINEQTLKLALSDDLTRLPNSRAFTARLVTLLGGSEAFSLAYIYVEGLGEVNDLFGPHRGDALLKGLAELLRENTTAGDFVGRLGGDKFAMLLGGSEARAAEVTHRIQAAFRNLVFDETGGAEAIAAVGIVSRNQASDPGRLIRLGYRAMLATTHGRIDTGPSVV